jgi:hypothetical protein
LRGLGDGEDAVNSEADANTRYLRLPRKHAHEVIVSMPKLVPVTNPP